MNLLIVCAAVKMNDGMVIAGVRHFSPDMRITLEAIYGEGYHLKVDEQGFITNKGEFVNRKEAWDIAEAGG